MKAKTFKKLTALLVAVMLIFSMCVTGISASAAAVSDGTKVVYLKPNSNWTQSGARFAVYVFIGGTNQWVDMSDSDKDGYYSATVPKGDWEKIIFCRMNPSNKENSWDTKWNQTDDLDIPEGMNCYVVKDGTWDKGGGEWISFDPEEPPVLPTTPKPDYDYTVAGDEGLTGASWDPEKNPMSDDDGDGIYEITFNNVPAGSHSFKVTDGTWNNCWGKGNDNYDITLNSTANVTIKFNSKTKEITVISDALSDFELKYMTVVGDGKEGNPFMNGKNWDASAEENKMTDMGNGIWSITFENVPAGTYEYKFIANNSYTYNWTVEGYFNSSDNSKLTVASNGSTVTLTIDISKYNFKTKEGSVTAKQTVVASDDPSNPATDPTKPTDVDYYLFGYINGANYGCEEDFENMGEYKFVDGELTVTFDQASYVAVKTTGNASWYMTDGWPGIVNTVTLYNTTKLDTTADKLMVPAGEVKFTLVVNDGDTLTLSYEADTVPTIPVETTEPTEQPSTEVTQPSTEEPTTEPITEPTTEPTDPLGDIVLYVAAPVFKEGTVWEDIYLTYSADSNLSKANKIAMTKTNNLYYSPKDVAGSLSGNTNWPVYKVNLTDEQAAAIDAANYAGFVNTANNISTSYIYSNSIFRANVDKEGYQAAKTSVSALNGKMFVIKGAGTLENKRKFLGSWVSESGSPAVATIYAASPVVNETKSMGDVYFRYGSSSTVSAATQFRMMQTDNWYTSNTTAKMLKAGKWITYSLDLTAEQIAEIDKSNYTGFTSIYGAEVRTRFTYVNSVTKACVGSYNSTYNTAITPISKLNGKMFIIEDSINNDTTSYLGYWGDYDTSIRTITIKAAVPNKVKDKTINSLQLVYSDVYEYSDAKAINMTKTDESFTPEQIHTDLIAPETEWTVYEATIDVSQIREISKVARVGFVSDGYQVNTRYSWSNNILRAGIGTYQNPYDTTTTADLQELDGATFVVCGSAKSTTTKDMIGYWIQ